MRKDRPRRLKVYFDGGCRPNPGPIEVAVVARGVAHFFDDLGIGTNTDAEWLALRMALQVAQSLDAAEFDLIGDSLEVVRQANGASRPGSESAAAHLARYEAAAAHRRPRQVKWTPRGQNLAGIALARRKG
ncbi:ribonuclease HI [Erythrobacter donghaensis]|uniref:ribonuclease HI n=1 Tax=Erythrobacter donghaensis TaxID=267135 RepID=UPI001FE530E5|nr:reverse transcriptase-like protein [Erythrobacter donghaensis]